MKKLAFILAVAFLSMSAFGQEQQKNLPKPDSSSVAPKKEADKNWGADKKSDADKTWDANKKWDKDTTKWNDKKDKDLYKSKKDTTKIKR